MTLILFCIYTEVCIGILVYITYSVRILFLHSLLQGVWRCPIPGEQDKSHALFLYVVSLVRGLGGRDKYHEKSFFR